jgi:hypothetical protein
VGEESHLDEMRSAIRGDFERLARRRGEQQLLRVSDEAVVDDEPEVAEAEAEPTPRSWLSRLISP